MRKPQTIERLYLDFDGFFASVMQQVMPSLRGKPVGVIPFETGAVRSTSVIACSKEAKARGVKNVMRVNDALALCPDIELVPQRPDLYRRAHGALLAEIGCEIPIDAIKSIDELTCKLDRNAIADPAGLARRIKRRLHDNIGPHITCSIGFASNRMLAKIACKVDKPNGVTIWHPEDLPAPLIALPMSDIPGVGGRMERRLLRAGITDIQTLLDTEPKQLRALWGNVNGERMWYALHGYDLQAEPAKRGMYGHGRVLPPEARSFSKARDIARMLLSKAARRMRRDGWYANRLSLWLSCRRRYGEPSQGFGYTCTLPTVHDEQACLSALEALWKEAQSNLPSRLAIIRLGVTLLELVPATARQLDLFTRDDELRKRWETITHTIDGLNRKFGQRVVTLGDWKPPAGGNVGGKISYTRIPSAEDFL